MFIQLSDFAINPEHVVTWDFFNSPEGELILHLINGDKRELRGADALYLHKYLRGLTQQHIVGQYPFVSHEQPPVTVSCNMRDYVCE
jgi:hypothetical protein